MISGHWTYRSYLNDPAMVDGDAGKALRFIFGEGVFDLTDAGGGQLRGVLDMGSGYALDLTGTAETDATGGTNIRLAGLGRSGSPTDGWEYDYDGRYAYGWPNAVNQIPAITGTALRAKPHNGGPAGLTASFIAVRQP
jgi:hypothetical protein